MGSRAVALIREKHTWDVKAARLVEIYRTITSGRNPD
jgi:hypothetical protein